MIRILGNGYKEEDYKFLLKLLEPQIKKVQRDCSEFGVMCFNCDNRRACFDVVEAVNFLNKEVSK